MEEEGDNRQARPVSAPQTDYRETSAGMDLRPGSSCLDHHHTNGVWWRDAERSRGGGGRNAPELYSMGCRLRFHGCVVLLVQIRRR